MDEDRPKTDGSVFPDRLLEPLVVGLFAGGRGERMGGCDKPSLRAPDTGEPLVERLARLAREAGLWPVVVGGPARGALPQLHDDPPNVGPIGGLLALLAHASPRPVLACACDLPFVTRALFERLAAEQPAALVLAPRDATTGKWQPLFARYDSARMLPLLRTALAEGSRSMQKLLLAIDTRELLLGAGEHALLADWDLPSDLP